MDKHLPLYNLFVKYLEDRCSPEEIRQLLLYFDDQENENVLRSLIKAELGFVNKEEGAKCKTDSAIDKVKSSLIKEIRSRKKLEVNNSNRKLGIRHWMKIAALWLVLITSVFLIINRKERNTDKKQVSKVCYTKPGERKLLHLYDGTKVWLSPSSSLEYQDQLIGNLREVKLEGEAFFEVAKDKTHPFIIHTRQMDTRVVGTSFNVQCYKDLSQSTVTVVTGIVKVSGFNPSHKKPQEVTLKPNQQSHLDSKKNILVAIDYPDAVEMLKRREGILTYSGALVADVIKDFSRCYNVKITLESKSKGCLCFGEFNTTRPLKIVLEQLATAINAKVVFHNDGIILKGGCEE